MKSFFLFVLALVVLGLTACGPGGAGQGSGNCSDGVCVTLRIVEPVHFGQPVTVLITVTSDQDRSDLGLTLYTDAIQATIDGPQGWESNARNEVVFKNGPSDGAGWSFDVKANVPVRFTRVLRFAEGEQTFGVFAALHVPPRSYVAGASVQIRYSREGVRVYGMGTPVGPTPRSPEALPAWIIRPDGTRIPYPTLLPTPTFVPRVRPTRTPTSVPAIPTPTRRPYP